METEQTALWQLPKRVKGQHTANFRTIDITTNHYKVNIPNFDLIFIFSVKFTPMIAYDNRSLRNKILKDCLPEVKTFIKNPVICGMNILSCQPATQIEKQVKSGDYTVKIKQVKSLNVKENPKVLLNFLNNSFRNIMGQLNYIQIGKSGKFFNVNRKNQFDNLIMYSGYKANYCMLQNGIYLRVDSAKKIVRNQTVLEFINDIYKIHQDKERDQRRKVVQNSLIGLTIMANYGKSRYYTVQDVVFKDIQTTVLEGETTSISKYYQEKYNITIRNLKQPLLKVENKKGKFDILLVPELCLMTGIPENFDQFRRKKVSENTILDAGQKERQIKDLMKQLKEHDQIHSLKQFGIQLSRNMERLQAKQITIPKITLGKDNKVQDGKQAFFNLFNKPIYASKHSIRCGVLYFSSADVRGLLNTFDSTARNLGVKFQIQQINIGDFDGRRAMDIIDKGIKKAIEKYECNICCIVIPNNLKTQYPRIKKLALIDNNMICQIVTDGTLRKKNLQSIATKVLLQIIAKRGNTLWVPKSKSSSQGIMLAAFDNAKVSGNKFMLGLCATVNSTFSSIASRSGTYDGNNNKFQLMCNQFISVIDAYTSRNDVPPKEIILFHNSCSFDQMKLYNQFFINPILKKMDQVYKENAPKFTMVMVNTKTSQRLFSQYNGRTENVKAGTLVNTTVVSNDYDFYIVSQNSNKGCVVPNHYKVISSNSKMEEGLLQELIFAQCFNYVNWTGSIKVPGILQYAKKCAKFNSEVLQERQLSQDLMNKLYFV